MVRSPVVIRRGGEVIHINDRRMAAEAVQTQVMDDVISRVGKKAVSRLEKRFGKKYSGIGAAAKDVKAALQVTDKSWNRSLRSLNDAWAMVRHLTEVGEEQFILDL